RKAAGACPWFWLSQVQDRFRLIHGGSSRVGVNAIDDKRAVRPLLERDAQLHKLALLGIAPLTSRQFPSLRFAQDQISLILCVYCCCQSSGHAKAVNRSVSFRASASACLTYSSGTISVCASMFVPARMMTSSGIMAWLLRLRGMSARS